MLLLGSNFTSSTVAKPVLNKAVVQMVDEEQRFTNLVNSERAANGLKVLELDTLLVQVGRNHAKEMCDKNYFNHMSPTPRLKTPLDRYLASIQTRPGRLSLGENLFYCSIVDVNRGHMCLMESPGHRANILNPKFDRIGVGVYKSPSGEFWVTEMFISD